MRPSGDLPINLMTKFVNAFEHLRLISSECSIREALADHSPFLLMYGSFDCCEGIGCFMDQDLVS